MAVFPGNVRGGAKDASNLDGRAVGKFLVAEILAKLRIFVSLEVHHVLLHQPHLVLIGFELLVARDNIQRSETGNQSRDQLLPATERCRFGNLATASEDHVSASLKLEHRKGERIIGEIQRLVFGIARPKKGGKE